MIGITLVDDLAFVVMTILLPALTEIKMIGVSCRICLKTVAASAPFSSGIASQAVSVQVLSA
jgi:hypothetical protein